eukprot:TRINITY_DN7763_c1_g1_i3.p1 TRINITY_DN7763_c1_g1~~TRINITY_DN7763_c1_g1_i3.p1  ORF type:complete len:314 (-),score=22.59 TRINITY_DN7763_c1_g1_i3:72-1013(-)
MEPFHPLSGLFSTLPQTAHSGRRPSVGIEAARDAFDGVVRDDLAMVMSQVSNTSLVFCSYKGCVSYLGVVYVWEAVDVGVYYLTTGQYMQVVRWLVELSTIPLFVFPLSCAALVQTVILMRASRTASMCPRFLHVLSSVLGTFVGLLTFFGLWMPGPMLVNFGEVFTMRDILMAVRWIGLAAVAFYALRPRRDSPKDAGTRDVENLPGAECSQVSAGDAAGSSRVEVADSARRRSTTDVSHLLKEHNETAGGVVFGKKDMESPAEAPLAREFVVTTDMADSDPRSRKRFQEGTFPAMEVLQWHDSGTALRMRI